MFDIGRGIAVLIALVWCVRARSFAGAVAALFIAYCYGLEAASGLALRAPAVAGLTLLARE